jgi:dolichyl-phosphate beta-glucosyltransferase
MPHHLAPIPNFMEQPPSLDVSLLIPAKNSAHSIQATVNEAMRFLDGAFPNSYEIILIPNPGNDTQDATLKIAEELAARHSVVRCIPHRDLPGKGAALRTGVDQARGKKIFFTDADLPYDLEFFSRASKLLDEGYDLVSGNRRLATSQFDIPVELLKLAYKRHKLGLGFNRVVRLFFPVNTRDTQAGIKAMSRELAKAAFSRMECPGFFFDLEIFLTARTQGMKQIDLPVLLFLNTEKSTVRVIRESILAAYWLTRIYFRQWSGTYLR